MSRPKQNVLPKNPMQPFVLTGPDSKIVRFKANALVRHVLDEASAGRKCDLNDLACLDFSADDRQQFAQLIGYSLGGYHELSYVSDEAASAASAAAQKLSPGCGGCRDGGCEIHSRTGDAE